MKTFKSLAIATVALGIMATSCQKENKYNLTGEVGDKNNNATVMLISFSNGDTLAVDTVRDGKFYFSETIETPILAQVRIGGRAIGTVILEPGNILMEPQAKVSGTPLNDLLGSFNDQQAEIYAQLAAINPQDSTAEEKSQALIAAYNALEDSVMKANLDNPVGATLMINNAYEMSVEDLQSAIEAHPTLASYSKLTKILDQKKVATETSVGHQYKDFEISYNGKTTKLSDLMVPGHYTLVDFWASWCGPCRREIPVIKEILEEYGPKGLDVVGVAVWDQPADTERAINELEITWPVIINAQTIPTDMYGILGIPSILLIGPDGTILSRDKQDQELKDAVAKEMASK